MRWLLMFTCSLPASAVCPLVASAQLPAFRPPEPGPVVVARVNDEPIYQAEVHRYLRKLPTTDEDNLKAGEPSALEALIQRQLVLEYLVRRNFVTAAVVEAQVEHRRAELAKRNERLETICEEQGITEAALRRAIAWNIAWPNYLGKYLDQKRLQRYFNEHRAHFDGGNRDVAHILWKLPPEMTKEQREELLETVLEVRQQIENEEISFAEAAQEHSSGPSAETGGELGSIDRDGPMTERFSEAAFDLEPGEVSGPVVDAFGIHLIRCLHAEPGKRKSKEVRSKVEQAARAQLFAAVASRAGKNAKIEHTGVIKVADTARSSPTSE